MDPRLIVFLAILVLVAASTVLIIGMQAAQFVRGAFKSAPAVATAGDQETPDDQPTAQPRPHAQPAPSYAPLVQRAATARLELHTLDASRRQHTLIAAAPGDGKTQTLNTLLCADVRAGHQAIVLNPQFTYYHPDDQPIDLRPVKNRFELVRDEAAMPGILKTIYQLGKEREPLYQEGEDVGHHISIIIDEWPRIVESDYGPACVELVRKIVREMRKCNIWITLAAQDGQVETLGFKSGVRASFATRLCGNVDAATWRALIGTGIPQTPVALGSWATSTGVATVQRPTSADIRALATSNAAYAPMEIAPVDDYSDLHLTDDELAMQRQPVKRTTCTLADVLAYLDTNPAASQRQAEKAIFGYTGGTAYQQVDKYWQAALLLRAEQGATEGATAS